jgi:hypothetical protein
MDPLVHPFNGTEFFDCTSNKRDDLTGRTDDSHMTHFVQSAELQPLHLSHVLLRILLLSLDS